MRASRANRFDPERIGDFVDATCDFLREPSGEEEVSRLSSRRALIGYLRDQADALGLHLRLSVWCYLTALGAWDGDAAKEIELRRARDTIGAMPWVTDVEVEAVDKSRLLDMMATSLPLRAGEVDDPSLIEIEDYEAALPAGGLVPLPRIGDVGAGYCGHVPVSAFLGLLEREDGQGLREAIFTQNVRGYQGDRGVNERIRATLAGPDRAEFLLRNNGVTVVADTLDREGRDVRLTNYQIVNGLQTSTVIYKMRDQLRSAGDVHVPIKLVATENNTVRRSIIDATNRQTPITGAALFAACEKALSIEAYFFERMRAGGPQLYLERRPGQYPRSFEAPRVSLEDLLRAYYAVFLEAPQVAEKGFAAIAGDVDDGLLAPSLTSEPYYVAARLLTLVREIAVERDEPRLAQLEHHAALAIRVMCAPQKPPVGDAGAMRAMCRRVELQLSQEGVRDTLAESILEATQSPRDRMRSRIQGVPTLKRTRDDVLKRARAKILADPR
ncbi:MAG: AIPR family protein [Pseudomonadota bacterium]